MAYIYLFKQLWRYAGPERWKIIVYFVLHAISILGELGQPYAFAMLLNVLQTNRPSLITDVLHWLTVYVVCVVSFRVFHVSARYLELPVAFRCRRRFVETMYDQLQALPLSWHTEHHSGNLIDRGNKAAEALHRFGEAQMCYIDVFMKFWGPLIILWRISPQISMASLVMGSLMVFATQQLYNRIVPLYRGQLETLHHFATAFSDYMSNMRTIITLRLGRYVKQDLDARLASVFPYIMREQNVTQVKCVLVAFLTLLLEVGVILYYIWAQKQAGTVILIGAVTAIFQYLGQLMTTFNFFAGDYEKVLHWRADFMAITPVFQAECSTDSEEQPDLRDWEQITIHPLRYSHDAGTLHLRDVSLTLQRGRKIAIVGESGCGKSTLLQALRGLNPILDAQMTVDGTKTLPLTALSNTATLIPQEPEIFAHTIRHNITLGIPACEEEVRNAIHVAGFAPVFSGLPNGLESDIREKGVNLSGGEKQRLALARGIFALRDSTLVLLDEPTSSIDARTEMDIFARLFTTLAGRCVVCSLHCLHLVRLFDYVYVMYAGGVVEEGTYDDLINRSGEFARLWSIYQAEDVQTVSTDPHPR